MDGGMMSRVYYTDQKRYEIGIRWPVSQRKLAWELRRHPRLRQKDDWSWVFASDVKSGRWTLTQVLQHPNVARGAHV